MSNEILILANKEGGAYDFAKGVYNYVLEHPRKKRDYSFGNVDIKTFNDGEIFAEVCENVRKRTCFFVHDSCMCP